MQNIEELTREDKLPDDKLVHELTVSIMLTKNSIRELSHYLPMMQNGEEKREAEIRLQGLIQTCGRLSESLISLKPQWL